MPHRTAGSSTVSVQVSLTVAAKRDGFVAEMLDEHQKEFQKLYFRWGWSLRMVAEHFKISLWSLERWMKIRHIESRDRSEAQKLRWARRDRKGTVEAIVTMRLKHRMSLNQIAKKTGVSRSGIHVILIGLGLNRPVDQLPSHEDYLKGVERRGEP